MTSLTEKFRARFIAVARERVQAASAALAEAPSRGTTAADQLHTLAGEAGALGYPGIMELARRAEKLARTAASDPGAASGAAAILREIAHAVDELAGPT